MLRTLALAGATWLATRVGVVLQAAVAWHSPLRVAAPRWIAVLGGGGEARSASAARLALSHPTARILLVGTGPEIRAMADGFSSGYPRPHPVLVAEPTTYGCLKALVAVAEGPGLVVTHESHGPRTLVSWFLAGGIRAPGVETVGSDGPDALELVKLAWYLLRY